jgi:hypothetical protein
VETPSKGNACESAVLNAFVERGYDVLIPFAEGQPYDLVVHLPTGEFLRVQCKAAREHPGCVVFNSRMTDHGRGRLSYAGLADIFGVYAPSTGSVYLMPITDITGFEGRLRLRATRNNQRRGVRYAKDFEFRRWTPDALRKLAADAEQTQRISVAAA